MKEHKEEERTTPETALMRLYMTGRVVRKIRTITTRRRCEIMKTITKKG